MIEIFMDSFHFYQSNLKNVLASTNGFITILFHFSINAALKMRHAKIHVSFDTLAATFQREFTKKRRRLSKI